MPTIMRFEEIEDWQTVRELTNLIYSLTEESKFSRDFGLKDQIRRASFRPSDMDTCKHENY